MGIFDDARGQDDWWEKKHICASGRQILEDSGANQQACRDKPLFSREAATERPLGLSSEQENAAPLGLFWQLVGFLHNQLFTDSVSSFQDSCLKVPQSECHYSIFQ